jgi:hypothetical protein
VIQELGRQISFHDLLIIHSIWTPSPPLEFSSQPKILQLMEGALKIRSGIQLGNKDLEQLPMHIIEAQLGP